MKVLFISKHKYPHIGGVEKHVYQISKQLEKTGHFITTISEEDIKQPQIKIIGLMYIWLWFLRNIHLIKEADVVHIHDVFIWILPFRFLFPRKKFYITFHGWEGKFPPTVWSIFNKRVANKLTNGSIAVGRYIEKWYGIKSNFIIHGAVDKVNKIKFKKQKNTIVWLGRQDKDTGYFEFKEWLETRKNLVVKYVSNDPNPEKNLKSAEFCVPSGYLSYLEAKNYGCKIITFANNPLKEDYWSEVKKLKTISTWDYVASIYVKLWE